MCRDATCGGDNDCLKLSLFSAYEALGMVQYPPSLESTLRSLSRSCRAYFPESATQEMLDEWRPLLCPFDVTFAKAMTYFEVFLPTYDVQRFRDKTYPLWFDEFMGFWDACHNSPPWENVSESFHYAHPAALTADFRLPQTMLSLYARLAEHNVGCIDWEPHVPVMFTRIQNSFGLPVTFKKINVMNKSTALDVGSLVKWVVATLGCSSATQQALQKLFQSLDSYYHTANFGHHSGKLMEFLSKLTSFFIRRLHRCVPTNVSL